VLAVFVTICGPIFLIEGHGLRQEGLKKKVEEGRGRDKKKHTITLLPEPGRGRKDGRRS